MMISEPLPGFVSGPKLSEQIGQLNPRVAFNYSYTFSTDPTERPPSVHHLLVGLPQMIRRSESRVVFRDRVLEIPGRNQADWNRGRGPAAEHDVIWLGWEAVGEIQSRRKMVVTGRLIQGGNELAANATNILRQFFVPHIEFEVNRAFRRFLTALDERFQGKWNPHPLMPSSDGLGWLPQASRMKKSPSQNGHQRPGLCQTESPVGPSQHR